MATKKTTKTNDRIKETVNKAKGNMVNTSKPETDGCEYIDPDETKTNTISVSDVTSTSPNNEKITFVWDADTDDTDVTAIEKFKLAKVILVRLIDFNIEQLARRNVDKVLIYDNPAEYAAEVVNELCERIGL